MTAAATATPDARSLGVRLRPTRFGLAAGGVAVAIIAAAVNTGNNLLYLLAALMLTAWPVSAWLARRAVREAALSVLLPAETTAGESASAAVRVRAGEHELAGLRILHDAVGGDAAGLAHLEAGGTAVKTLEIPTARRGPLTVRLRLECLFPWGLLLARADGPSAELLVLPRALAGAEAPRSLSGSTDGRASLRPGPSQDLLEIREYRPGDDARSIDWKATARRERPMIRQGTLEQETRAAVVVHPACPPGDGATGRAAVEDAISRAAGALRELAGAGWSVRLVLPGAEVRGSELDQLRALARLRVPEAPPAHGWWRARLAPGEPFVLCAPEAPG